ncbi:unnamed protein product [Dracunculus medinensis]|uniref:CYCLIN domain-containing protein n=1 Tax=Dracunculus medinensis TaxID=318479 RepID=A0A0N4UDQ9_DRAME|nr:unnamed protein product [Dracunculus medinensis]
MENPSDNKTSLLCYEEIIDSPTVLKRNESVKGQGSCLKLSNIKSNNVIKNYLSDDKNRRLVLGQIPKKENNERLKENLEILNKQQIPSVMPSIDKTIHFENDTFCYLLKLERVQPRANAFHFRNLQQTVTVKARQQTIRWIIDVCNEELSGIPTLFAAISIMDRFLSLEKLSLNKLQVMASGCLSIAAKLRDPNFITPSQIIYYTDYSINQLQLLILCEYNIFINHSQIFGYDSINASRVQVVSLSSIHLLISIDISNSLKMKSGWPSKIGNIQS